MKPGRRLTTVRELLHDPDVDAAGEAGQPDHDVPETPEEVAGMAELFSGLCGAPCPPELRAGLLLPDRVAVRWTRMAAAASRGIVFWQFLFCEGRVTPDKARHLAVGLRRLRDRYGDPELVELEERLKKRS